MLTNLRLSQRGSFGDIAASSLEEWSTTQVPTEANYLEQLQSQSIKAICDADWKDLLIERLPEIPTFTLLVGWTGQVAITDSPIQATEKKRKVETDSAFYKEFLKRVTPSFMAYKMLGTNKTYQLYKKASVLTVHYWMNLHKWCS